METATQNHQLEEFLQTQSVESENVKLVKRFYSLLDQLRFDDMKNILTEKHEVYYQSSKEPATLEDMKPMIEMFYTSFPDYTHNLGNAIAEGDMVSIQMTYTATHKKKFMDIEPTNNKIDYAGIGIFKIRNGKIDKMWIVEDELTMMKQLGVALE